MIHELNSSTHNQHGMFSLRADFLFWQTLLRESSLINVKKPYCRKRRLSRLRAWSSSGRSLTRLLIVIIREKIPWTPKASVYWRLREEIRSLRSVKMPFGKKLSFLPVTIQWFYRFRSKINSFSVSTFISSKVITPTKLRSTILRSTDNSL